MSEPTDPVKGSIEIFTPEGESIGLAVEAAMPADVPVILRALYGFEGITGTGPVERANRRPSAEWRARNRRGQTIEAVLWKEQPFDPDAPIAPPNPALERDHILPDVTEGGQ